MHTPVVLQNEQFLNISKPAATILLSLFVFFAIEVALQLRAEIKTGRSVFSTLFDEPTMLYNKELEFSTFRPNATISGSDVTIVTNSLGLRSPEINQEKPPRTLRVAFLGASTVFGAYASHNESLMSYRFKNILESSDDNLNVEILNAGLPGRMIAQQRVVLEKLIIPYKPDFVIIYTGLNDFSALCRGPTKSDGSGGLHARRFRELIRIKLPSWLLSVELVRKNTVQLRETASVSSLKTIVEPDMINMEPYNTELSKIISISKHAGSVPVVATLARAFSPTQSQDEQIALSQSFRYYYNCFTMDGLNKLYERYNASLRTLAQQNDAVLVDLASYIPPGPSHFADASHFNAQGEQVAAEALSRMFLNILNH